MGMQAAHLAAVLRVISLQSVKCFGMLPVVQGFLQLA